MGARKPQDRRRSRRRVLNRLAKVQCGVGTLARDCLITDISDGGVRLHVQGFEVSEEFVLSLSGEGLDVTERAYRVVWRLGYEVGAKCIGVMRRGALSAARA